MYCGDSKLVQCKDEWSMKFEEKCMYETLVTMCGRMNSLQQWGTFREELN